MYKKIACFFSQSLKVPSELDKYGFLDPNLSDYSELAFRCKKNGSGNYFNYAACVLGNALSPKSSTVTTNSLPDILKAANLLCEHLRTGNTSFKIEVLKDDKKREMVAKLQAVSTFPNEKVFYFIHQMIEALSGNIFSFLSDPNDATLEGAIKAFTNINVIMANFNNVVTPEQFMKYRPSLGNASGAQSPLRWLDITFYLDYKGGGLEVDNEGLELPSDLEGTFKLFQGYIAKKPGLNLQSPDQIPFFTKLSAQYPDYKKSQIMTEFQDFCDKKKLILFMKQYLHYKLYHYQIVDIQLGFTKPGTAGTNSMCFLGSSIARTYFTLQEL